MVGRKATIKKIRNNLAFFENFKGKIVCRSYWLRNTEARGAEEMVVKGG